jgi:predicted benzoate:H+ symporter BenE
MQDMKKFFRANPQALVLLVICVVLGFGAFLAVMIGLLTAGSSTTTGEPSGVIAALNLLG